MARVRIPNPDVQAVLVASLDHKRSNLARQEAYVQTAEESLMDALAGREKTKAEVASLEKYLNDEFPGWDSEDQAISESIWKEVEAIPLKAYRIMANELCWTAPKIAEWWTNHSDEVEGIPKDAWRIRQSRVIRALRDLTAELEEDDD